MNNKPIITQVLTVNKYLLIVKVPCPDELKLFDYNINKLIVKIEKSINMKEIQYDINHNSVSFQLICNQMISNHYFYVYIYGFTDQQLTDFDLIVEYYI